MEEQATVNVLRITRDDTLQVREWCPICGTCRTEFIVLAEVWCDGSREHIRDWVELNKDEMELVVYDYLRDEYGRLLADLRDRDTGHTLTDYLVKSGTAKRRPHHVSQVFEEILRHMEPGDAVG